MISKDNSGKNMGSSSFLFLDINQGGKLVLLQWSVKGVGRPTVSRQYIRRLINVYEPCVNQMPLPTPMQAKALAKFHSSDKSLDLMFYQQTVHNMQSYFKKFDIAKQKNKRKNDRTATLIQEIGTNLCSSIMRNLVEDYEKCFPEYSGLKVSRVWNFRKNKVISFHGSNNVLQRQRNIGRDLGVHFAYPFALMMAYASRGDNKSIQIIMASLRLFRNIYSEALFEEGKDKEFVYNSYRHGLGWCGWFLYLSYRIRAFKSTQVLPLEGLYDEDRDFVLESIGVVGLKLMQLAYGNGEGSSLGLDQLYRRMDDIVEEEVEALLGIDIVNRLHTFDNDVPDFDFPSLMWSNM